MARETIIAEVAGRGGYSGVRTNRVLAEPETCIIDMADARSDGLIQCERGRNPWVASKEKQDITQDAL